MEDDYDRASTDGASTSAGDSSVLETKAESTGASDMSDFGCCAHDGLGDAAGEHVVPRLHVTSKVDLRQALERLSANATGIMHATWGVVDCLSTYTRNIKDPPATPLLPGFTPEGISREPDKSLAAFKHFCRSQLGQRGQLFVYFKEIPPPAPRAGRVLADFDAREWGGDEYLTLMQGAFVISAPPPCQPEGWAFGILNGTRGFFPPSYVRWLS
jgi:hypothetical protein